MNASATSASSPSIPTDASQGADAPDLSSLRVAVIGAGNMGGPVATCMIRAGVPGEQVLIVNSTPESSQRAADDLGARAADSREEALAGADVIVLGVKPYQIIDLLGEVGDAVGQDAVVLSLAAGVTLEAMENALPNGTAVVRAMPNTPIGIGEGVVALMSGSSVSAEQETLVRALFAEAGAVEEITEAQVHAVIGAAGSAPAFAYYAMEAMIEEAVRQGLKRPVATRLVAQTLRGAATMVLETGEHPAVLRSNVSSPGGTTVQGIAALDREGVRTGLAAAMEAAARSSKELSGE